MTKTPADVKASTAIGPTDSKKAFRRVTNILDRLDPEPRRRVLAAIDQYSKLDSQLELPLEKS